jgi:hypothetical protein
LVLSVKIHLLVLALISNVQGVAISKAWQLSREKIEMCFVNVKQMLALSFTLQR